MILPISADGLLPAGIYSVDADSVFETFVLPFPDSQTRRTLFRRWEAYNQQLKNKLGGISLTQWLNGSFVTSKRDPTDIDLVTFVPSLLYQRNEEDLIDLYTTILLFNAGLDAYICPVFLPEESGYAEFQQRRDDWQHLFGQVRSQKKEKGFLTLTF